MLPLAVREMRAWLEGAKDRVVVLHCKGAGGSFLFTLHAYTNNIAGKGRSGTMACSYLLSLDNSWALPPLARAGSAKERANSLVDKVVESLPEEIADSEPMPTETDVKLEADSGKSDSKQEASLPLSGSQNVDTDSPSSHRTRQSSATNASTHALQEVLDLHTSRRMRTPSPSKQRKQGVSIPSQKRWLYYWSLLLAHEVPSHMWPLCPNPDQLPPKVNLTQVKLRMREPSGVKMNLVQAASRAIEATNLGKMGPRGYEKGQFWASVARYDDQLVDLLEKKERNTRDDRGKMAERKPDSAIS